MKLRPFQIGLIGFFGFIALTTLVVFSNFQGFRSGEVNPYGSQVVIWGTFDKIMVSNTIGLIEDVDDRYGVVSYVEIDEREFESALLNAIAEGRSPDVVLLPHDLLVKYRTKLAPLSYEFVPRGTYENNYVEGAEIFLLQDGVYALPLLVDPLVMYWNRDLFSNAGIATPPSDWGTLRNDVVPKLTKRSSTFDLLQSAVALGEYSNINNAKAILSLLAIQSGSQMILDTESGYQVRINDSQNGQTFAPFDAALAFYTEFANRGRSVYSWNRAQPLDRNRFTSGDLAIYFGFASEATLIQDQNPNLNFTIAPVPQGAGASAVRGYGTFYGLAIVRASQNHGGSYQAALELTKPEFARDLAANLGLASADRSVIAAGDQDPFRQTFLTAALTARGWLDPDPDASALIFQDMIEDVTSGRSRINESITEAKKKLELAF